MKTFDFFCLILIILRHITIHTAIKKMMTYLGDEFAGILVEKQDDHFQKRLLKIKYQLESLHIENRKSLIKPFLNCSIGIDIITDTEYDFEEIYIRADKALYMAKAQGRDTVVYL